MSLEGCTRKNPSAVIAIRRLIAAVEI